MSMEERLQAISAASKPGAGPPKADTLATLLSQALQSQDKKILNVSTVNDSVHASCLHDLAVRTSCKEL